MKKLLFALVLLSFTAIGYAQEENSDAKEIEWLTFEEAVKRNQEDPRKFIIDVYTDWCGWCKKMEATTFKNPVIVDYISEHYHAVKLNAEQKDSMVIGGTTFINEKPDQRRYPHQVAIQLLGGKMKYPSIVYLDEGVNMIQVIQSYLDAKNIEPIIKFFGEDAYKETEWEAFQKAFKSELASSSPTP